MVRTNATIDDIREALPKLDAALLRGEAQAKEADLFYRIGKIALKPGEILVLKTEEHLSDQQFECLHEGLTKILTKAGCPEQPVMILQGGLDLVVIDPRDFGGQAQGVKE